MNIKDLKIEAKDEYGKVYSITGSDLLKNRQSVSAVLMEQFNNIVKNDPTCKKYINVRSNRIDFLDKNTTYMVENMIRYTKDEIAMLSETHDKYDSDNVWDLYIDTTIKEQKAKLAVLEYVYDICLKVD